MAAIMESIPLKSQGYNIEGRQCPYNMARGVATCGLPGDGSVHSAITLERD